MTVETTGEATNVEPTTPTIPRALRCRAYRCTNQIEAAGMCVAHRRGLALTASVSDAVREFLNRTPDVQNGRHAASVADAGECFAQGLALLVGTQFERELAWNCAPLVFARGRWRIRFSWAVTDENTFCGPTDFAEPGNDDDENETDENERDGDE